LNELLSDANRNLRLLWTTPQTVVPIGPPKILNLAAIAITTLLMEARSPIESIRPIARW